MTGARRKEARSTVTVRQVRDALDERYPFAHRADWDNVGILAGDPDRPVRSILLALDATPAVIGRCLASKADLLVTHHPVIHSPLKAVRPDRTDSSAAFRLLSMGVAVLSAHTNADVAPQGVSHVLARRIGLRKIRPLIPGEPYDACKVVVFVPADRADAALSALSEAGGGRIGAYTRCSFRTPGTGTFLPEPGASPWTGTPGALERVEEVRLESVVAAPLVPAVLRAIRSVHPYEEPAIDVIPLRGGALGGGIGAIGDRERKAPLNQVLGEIFHAVRPSWILVAGPTRKSVGRIAVVGGSGSEFAEAARAAGADLFVTADVKYHRALEAQAGDMPVADIGHGSGEKWILPEFRRAIVSRFGNRVSVQVILENEPLRPFRPGRDRGGKRK